MSSYPFDRMDDAQIQQKIDALTAFEDRYRRQNGRTNQRIANAAYRDLLEYHAERTRREGST